MANPRVLLKRRRAATNMRKITKTMEMVATAKLARAHQAAVAARPYARELEKLVAELTRASADFRHPLLAPHPAIRKAAVLVLTSDRGLCAAFNANVVRQARELRAAHERRGIEVEFIAQGRKGAGALRHLGWPPAKVYLGVSDKPAYERAAAIGDEFIRRFLAGEIDEAHIVYSSFASRTSQVPVVGRLLPLAASAEWCGVGAPQPGAPPSHPSPATGGPGAGHPSVRTAPPIRPAAWYLFHPGAEAILAEMLPLALKNAIFSAMLETCAGEHAARRVAMKNATDAADEMIAALTRQYNRARQYKITQEIAEIVGGVEAL